MGGGGGGSGYLDEPKSYLKKIAYTTGEKGA